MNVKNFSLTILTLFLTYETLLGQHTEEQDIGIEIQVDEENTEGYGISLRFIFAEMSFEQYSDLIELYVEFGVMGKITSGKRWGKYILAAQCSEDIANFEIDSLEHTIGNPAGSTHYWRLAHPQTQLEYHPESGGYSLDLYSGLCPEHTRDIQMIGYVDIILNASDPQEPEPLDPFDHCSSLRSQINRVVYTYRTGEVADSEILHTAIMQHGPSCERVGFRHSDLEATKGLAKYKVRIFPNPAINQLQIQMSEVRMTTFHLYHADGRLLRSKISRDQQVRIPIDDLPEGIYFLQVDQEEEIEVHKVLITSSY